jgi:hypothetical protein
VIVDNPSPGVYDGGAFFPALIGVQSGNPVVSDAAFRTTLLHRCLDRLRAGDGHAYDELIDLSCDLGCRDGLVSRSGTPRSI